MTDREKVVLHKEDVERLRGLREHRHCHGHGDYGPIDMYDPWIEDLADRILALLEQEPVAWVPEHRLRLLLDARDRRSETAPDVHRHGVPPRRWPMSVTAYAKESDWPQPMIPLYAHPQPTEGGEG